MLQQDCSTWTSFVGSMSDMETQARAHVKAESGLKTGYALEGIKSGAGREFAWPSG